MTLLAAISELDMTAFSLEPLRDGTNIDASSANWIVDGGAGLRYEFAGGGLTYSGDRPSGGTISALAFTQSGAPLLNIHGEISAAAVSAFVAADDSAGLFAQWFEGNDKFLGSNGNDHLLGYDGRDTFDLSAGGMDIAEGGSGNDTFFLGADFNGDVIDGGGGFDTLVLDGDYDFDDEFDMSHMNHIDMIKLKEGNTYSIGFDAANVPDGGLTIDGSALRKGSILYAGVDGANPLTAIGGRDGDHLRGGDGSDHLLGGKARDFLEGEQGADFLTGGEGKDEFDYFGAADSGGVNFDTITDLNVDHMDKFFLITHIPRNVDAPVIGGTLSLATFDADLEAALGRPQLHWYNAVVFSPDAGDFAGETFIVIDNNRLSGYQAGFDIVIKVTGMVGELDAGDMWGFP